MKRTFVFLIVCIAFSVLFSSCISQMAINAASNALAPKASTHKDDSNSMMLLLTGESDPVLMGEFFPTALKLYEIMYSQNPSHYELGVMTGSLYVMYANAFIQHKADMLSIEQFDLQLKEIQRARMHYLRGRDYALQALTNKYAGFSTYILSGDEKRFETALSQLKLEDVNAAYWAGAGMLGAFALNPLDAEMLRTITGAVALLEKAAELQSNYSSGAIWDILCAFYAAAPADIGGNFEKAIYAHEQSITHSEGKNVSVYITAATSLAVPLQDGALFDELISKALSVDITAHPTNRLANTIAREKALWLKENRENYFIEW